jgi:hypothetical protein
MEIFAAGFIALYVGHHVGDYWVQSDHDAAHKGLAGWEGRLACLRHVGSYVLTQAVCAGITMAVTGGRWHFSGFLVAMLVSGVFHYAADRREFGLMFRLARLIPGKAKFLTLGVPRKNVYVRPVDEIGEYMAEKPLDNPSLGTGAWALDQSWHLATSVFLPALILAAFS